MRLLTAERVTKRFGGLVAVNALDFTLEEGSIVSVIGPNGAGKTTFFNCIAGFYRIDEGVIRLGDLVMNDLRPDQIAAIGISRTYQNIRLFANMSAMENVLVGQHRLLVTSWIKSVLKTRGVQAEEAAAMAEARRLLQYVGLQGRGDLLASKLSYGDQRRLEIARALATKPRLLLLDEPTAGMNPTEKAAMTAFIRRLRDDVGITILLIEHEMRVVMGISERITVLDYGEKIAEGTAREIQSDARVIEAYLGRGSAGESGRDHDAGEAAEVMAMPAPPAAGGAPPAAGGAPPAAGGAPPPAGA